MKPSSILTSESARDIPSKRWVRGVLGLVLLATSPAWAATFTVNSLLDTSDANPGDGVCDTPAGGPPQCTLRAAIEEANANGNPGATDTIDFSLGLITISISGSPLPTITQRLIIDGRTAPSYNGSATAAADAPPSIYIDGGSLGGTTADGFKVDTGLSLTQIYAIGITNFPDNGIEVVNDDLIKMDGNWIGVGRTGTIAGNAGNGVELYNSTRCVVGQEIVTSPSTSIKGVGNVIGNNGGSGVYVFIGGDHLIAGNLIGDDPIGSLNMGNAAWGVDLEGPNDKVGGFSNNVSTPNIIRRNASGGVHTLSGGHLIYANTIYQNSGNGVELNGANNRLGYVAAGMRNLIQGNSGHGVVIGNLLSSSSNTVQNNWIYQNGQRGVQIASGGNNNITTNQIFDNTGDAARFDDAGNHLANNDIGFLNGALVGNGANGVVLNADGNDVAGNRIGAMDDDAIDVVAGAGNTISGNQIGMSNSGTNWGNTTSGVRVRAAASNTLIEDNRIGHNPNGIILEGGGTSICNNRIGVGTGDELAGNLSEGIWAQGGGNTIGDPGNGCAGNVIGDNGSDGIEVWGAANIIRNNQIGGVPGTDLGNHNGGILLTTANAYLNEIVLNTLVYNDNDGVRIGSTSGTRNRIENNSFTDNGDQGIDINDDGATANDVGDMDSGPNNVQNTPVITALMGGSGQLTVTYRIDTNTVRGVYPLHADFYLAGNGSNQGKTFLQRDDYPSSPTPPNTNYEKTFVLTLPGGVSSGNLTAMVIDDDGSSSEFMVPMAFTATPASSDIFYDGFE